MINTVAGLVAYTQTSFANLREQRKDEALSLFKLGKILNETTINISINYLSEKTGVGANRLKMCMKLAEAIPDESMFHVEWAEIEHATFDKLYSKLVGRKEKKKPLGKVKVWDTMKELFQELDLPETRYEAMEILKDIRSKINKKVQSDLTIADKEYIKYYECSCCGSYPPPEHGYIISETEGMFYPICESCYVKEEPPDYKRIAKMYSNYSISLSRVLLAGTLQIEEDDINEESPYI